MLLYVIDVMIGTSRAEHLTATRKVRLESVKVKVSTDEVTMLTSG